MDSQHLHWSAPEGGTGPLQNSPPFNNNFRWFCLHEAASSVSVCVCLPLRWFCSALFSISSSLEPSVSGFSSKQAAEGVRGREPAAFVANMFDVLFLRQRGYSVRAGDLKALCSLWKRTEPALPPRTRCLLSRATKKVSDGSATPARWPPSPHTHPRRKRRSGFFKQAD